MVMVAYYGVLAVVLLVFLIGLRYNPVDPYAYDSMSRRILGSSAPRSVRKCLGLRSSVCAALLIASLSLTG